MRILKANGQILDIDDDTAIGIDYQAYDFKKPGEIKVNVSNTFTIPATAKNLRIFGFAGRTYSQSNATFTRITVDYYIRNEQYITKGVARIEKIEKGRIHLFVAERPTFIDEMKSTSLNDFLEDWFKNSFVNEEFNLFEDFVDAYKQGHNGVIMPLTVGNLLKFQDVEGNTPEKINYYDGTNYKNVIGLNVIDNQNPSFTIGCHFFVFIDELIKYIESYFDVNLNSDKNNDYNIFNDSLISELFIPVRNIFFNEDIGIYNLQIVNPVGSVYNFSPHEDLKPYDGLNVYDLFINILKLLGYAIEPIQDGSFDIVRLDLIDIVTPETGDFLPGYMADNFQEEKFIPNLEGYGVNNYIKMKPFSEGGEFLGSKKSVNENKNLDENKDLLKIDAYIPPFLQYSTNFIADLSEKDSFKTITFLKKTYNYVNCRVIGNYGISTLSFEAEFPPKINYPGKLEIDLGDYETDLMVPEVYTVASEYKFLDEILNTPETRTVKRWVNSSMMKGFRKLAPYYVREFGAWYFVNKISNFNPEKSKEPVKFELIRLPWVRMPGLPEKEIEPSDEWILATGKWNDEGIWIDTETWKDN